MSIESGFGYLQARIQARHGNRPDGTVWAELDHSRDLGHCLQVARGTSLRPWVAHFAADAASSEIEHSLRASWQGYVDEIAAWAPARWRPAARWPRNLIYLPLLEHLGTGGSAPAWLSREPRLAALAQADEAVQRQALAEAGLAGLAGPDIQGQRLQRWLQLWRALWPDDVAVNTLSGLERLARLLSGHVRDLLEAPLPAALYELRVPLEQALIRAFRAYAATAVAMFCHLGITALDMERLRAALLGSRLAALRGVT